MFTWLKDALRRRHRHQALEYLETLPPWLHDDLGLEVAELRKLRIRGLRPHPPRTERPLEPATFQVFREARFAYRAA